MASFGKILIIIGAILALMGAIFVFAEKIPCIGRLPGDIDLRRGKFTFYFPLATSIIISLLLTIIFSLFRK